MSIATERTERSTSRGRGLVCGSSFPSQSSVGPSSYDRIIGASMQQSSGRGGAGNIRSPSREPIAPGPGPEDYSDPRGRDPIPSRDPYVVCYLLQLSDIT